LQKVEIELGARSDSHHAHTDRERENTHTREVAGEYSHHRSCYTPFHRCVSFSLSWGE